MPAIEAKPSNQVPAANVSIRRSRYGSDRGRIASSILELTAASAPKQLGLYEELALAKTLVQDTVNVYEATTTQLENWLKAGIADPKVLSNAFSMLNLMQPRIEKGLDTVRAIAKTAADIELAVSISPDMLAFLAAKIERVITETPMSEDLREDLQHELLTAFADTTIRSQQASFNILSPADTVYTIDKAVPEVECTQESYEERLGKELEDTEPLPEWTTLDDLEKRGE